MALSGSLLSKSSSQERSDLVAFWSVPLLDGIHTVEFEHGGTTGKRVIRVDGKEILRRDWMFKLVGDEKFTLGKQGAKCELHVDPLPHFAFAYSLYVDGKPLEKFTEKQSQTTRSWAVVTEGKRYRVVFEKQTLNVWVNGQYVETESVFIDGGSEMTFEFEDLKAAIRATSTDRKQGVIHQLYVNGKLIEEDIY
ncbi:fas apoptotic inhibitory molecule 1 [Tribolium castaneum]|uniref:Fas apoptotic inhibitory molecule 1-like Protein n=1 Tax=Tribolium castaneum TaxID=7070 RepID=D6WRI9_TRICA|nr:PREDICTED: fas apoptotic inhibitory molecule 1 [Tribolium castaneum]EFA06444.1 Fas apoptotic inhibitory molecule 1-like Protein [Tribolium castaneum]|eukprot:XP_974423.1 PREDICTED: fas apoptotic inhibitory molecule 1 [Tribolium castaneum]